MAQAQDRRNTVRTSINIQVVEEYLTEEQEVQAINISEHGMQYNRPKDAPRCQGKEVFLTFNLLERLKPIRALGWVVEETEKQDFFETHVTFMFLPEKDEEMIREFVAAKAA